MNQQALETFLVVAQCKSLSRAAQLLNRTQSAVTKRVQQLEEELGVPLFKRGRGQKMLELTEPARLLTEYSNSWLELNRKIHSLKYAASRDTLRIGAVPAINLETMNGLYRRLIAEKPEFQLSLYSGRSRWLYQKIETRQLDIAFARVAQSSHWAKTVKLYSEPLVGLCTKTSPLAGRTQVDPSELDPSEELFTSVENEFHTWHDRYWPPYCPGRVYVDSLELVVVLLTRDRQWCLVPKRITEKISRLNFSSFEFSVEVPKRHCYMVVSNEAEKNNPAVREAARTASEMFAEDDDSAGEAAEAEG